ncbi:unnamed protein product [Prunus armeniaca]|uniref:Chalcone synthase n=1 Tax=Prunus armeniaca TaxID=36596 RepID=A0A6J5XAT5_PRUAR|nr:unnamed protein product [Prunus armeniaca]
MSASKIEAKSPAAILAIGTANPANCYYQQDYPDFLFRVTNSDHLTELKDKFKRICEKSMVKKRYLHITEEILKANPNICRYKAPSLDPRQDMLILEVPKLGKEAALKAIEEWGQPISNITHLIFCTSSYVDMPGADFQLVKLLGLDPSVNRFMIYVQGCFAGGTALRLAKDVAENNPGARVLVVCCEITNMYFQAPTETHVDVLVGQALFSDGAAASIVGANPDPKINERQVYEIMSTRETIVPYSEHGVVVHFREMGCEYYLSPDVPNIHPGGPAILDTVEEKLGLNEGKLRATRHVLREYGNMGSPSVLFVLDEMRKKSMEEGKATTGEGLEWGVLIGIGPGLTVETVVLRSARIAAC